MIKRTIKIIESTSLDPFFNLAYEEYFLDNLEENKMYFFLYSNMPSIIIGKHQNPWKECRVTECLNQNIKILRRLTGGGTVYHDAGNLNFSFIAEKNLFNKEKQTKMILNTLKDLGLPVYSNKYNDILIEKKKISGSAFFYNKNAGIHHGTLLVNADINNILYFLNPENLNIDKKSVPSRKSDVVNITNYLPDSSIDYIKEKLIGSFCKYYNIKKESIKIRDFDMPHEIHDIIQKYKSFDWIFGRTPGFSAESSGVKNNFIPFIE